MGAEWSVVTGCVRESIRGRMCRNRDPFFCFPLGGPPQHRQRLDLVNANRHHGRHHLCRQPECGDDHIRHRSDSGSRSPGIDFQNKFRLAACGACTVHLGGVATRSCVVPVSLVGSRPVLTIEAMAEDPVGRAVQDAWVSHDVVQCGYCQSGQIMSAVALLKSTPKPTDVNIEESMGGNLCRCATYVRIRAAIKAAAQQLT